MRTSIKIFGIIAIIFILLCLYNFFVLGQKDFGFFNVYSYCENGVYKTYPANVTDGTSLYYDEHGGYIGECTSWIMSESCAKIQKLAGTCETGGVPLHFPPL